jgi:hypothetical protein
VTEEEMAASSERVEIERVNTARKPITPAEFEAHLARLLVRLGRHRSPQAAAILRDVAGRIDPPKRGPKGPRAKTDYAAGTEGRNWRDFKRRQRDKKRQEADRRAVLDAYWARLLLVEDPDTLAKVKPGAQIVAVYRADDDTREPPPPEDEVETMMAELKAAREK